MLATLIQMLEVNLLSLTIHLVFPNVRETEGFIRDLSHSITDIQDISNKLCS